MRFIFVICAIKHKTKMEIQTRYIQSSDVIVRIVILIFDLQ